MRAYLRSARIAPKKASVIAQMVRGLKVPAALDSLEHTHKKGARLILALLKSAVANASHNDKQRMEELVIRTIVVNQAQGYRRGVSMARGRMRPVRKFLSHIEIVLGVADSEGEMSPKSPRKPTKLKSEKTSEKTSRNAKSAVQKSRSQKKTDVSSDSSASSASSVSS
ncbi:MAG: 50S ribosomal protein L22 [Candidatus Peribacteraceae bacterium]|nr:50S ribosomal protein L22 [Candidatus Peribacteraceae bacterium]MDD5739460.1 50S ribosomal protein L22 [Candidatus Peribacteraceae bacterium]